MAKIMLRKSADFDRPVGAIAAKVADISPEVSSDFGKQQVIITWVLEPTYTIEGETTEPKHYLHSEYVSCSIHEKSKLRKVILSGMTGRTLTDQWFETNFPDGYDTGRLLGKPMVLVLQTDENGYSKMTAVLPATDAAKAISIAGFKRPPWIDRVVLASISKPAPTETSSGLTPDDVLAQI